MPVAEFEKATLPRIPQQHLDYLLHTYGYGVRFSPLLVGTYLAKQGELVDDIFIVASGQLLITRVRPFGNHTSVIEEIDGTGYVVGTLSLRIPDSVSPDTVTAKTDTRGLWFTRDEVRKWNGAAAPYSRIQSYIDAVAEAQFRSLTAIDLALMGNPLWTNRGLNTSAMDRFTREPWCASTLRRFW